MKAILCICLGFFSFAVFAFPEIGDRALFRANGRDDSGRTYSAFHTFEILQMGRAPRTYLIQRTVDTPQGRTVQTYTQHENELGTDIFYEELLANCQPRGGQLEVVIVPAGTFQTCRRSFRDERGWNTVWYTTVNFGYVKYEQNQSRFYNVFELESQSSR